MVCFYCSITHMFVDCFFRLSASRTGKKAFVKHTRMGNAGLNLIMKTLLLLNAIINYIRSLFAIRLHTMIQNEKKNEFNDE